MTKTILNDLIVLDDTYYRAYELLMDLEIGESNLDNAISYANVALKANPSAYSILARLASVYNEMLDYQRAKDNEYDIRKVKKRGRRNILTSSKGVTTVSSDYSLGKRSLLGSV